MQTDRQRQREKEREMQTDRQTGRQTETERERERCRQTDRDRERKREKERRNEWRRGDHWLKSSCIQSQQLQSPPVKLHLTPFIGPDLSRSGVATDNVITASKRL